MKLPKSITVFGKECKLIKNKEPRDDHGKVCIAIFDTDHFQIEYNSDEMTKKVLIHELVHALSDRLGWEQMGLDVAIEEAIAENVAVFLTESNNFDLRFKRKK